jgi:hypothetical protein
MLIDCVDCADISRTFYNVYIVYDLFSNVAGDIILKFLEQINLHANTVIDCLLTKHVEHALAFDKNISKINANMFLK